MPNNTKFSNPASARIFLVVSAVLFLGALALFIWLLVDTAEDRMLKSMLYASAFLLVTIGLLVYSLMAEKSHRLASWIMWILMALGVGTFIAGIATKNPERQVLFDDGTPNLQMYESDHIPDSLHLIHD